MELLLVYTIATAMTTGRVHRHPPLVREDPLAVAVGVLPAAPTTHPAGHGAGDARVHLGDRQPAHGAQDRLNQPLQGGHRTRCDVDHADSPFSAATSACHGQSGLCGSGNARSPVIGWVLTSDTVTAPHELHAACPRKGTLSS